MENQENYSKFYNHFDLVIRRLAKFNPLLFNHIDLEDFLIFFEEPSSKGKNKGLPRSYNIFDHFLKNSQRKFSDENYVEDVCLALTYDKIRCTNGLVTTVCERMVYMYKESKHCKTTFVDYSTLENELRMEDTTASSVANDLKDLMFHKVFEAGYLNVYFNGSDLIMLKEYLKSKIKDQTNIKEFSNYYKDSRMLSAKAYDTRLRNVFKAWVAVLSVKFGLWICLEGFNIPFGSFQESVGFLNNLKPLKERREYFKKLTKKLEKHNKETTSEDKKLRSKVLKEYLIQRFGITHIREIYGDFEVKVGNSWCLKYFLNGGYNDLKNGITGSWLKDLNIS